MGKPGLGVGEDSYKSHGISHYSAGSDKVGPSTIMVPSFLSFHNGNIFLFVYRTGSSAIGAGFQAFVSDWDKVATAVGHFNSRSHPPTIDLRMTNIFRLRGFPF